VLVLDSHLAVEHRSPAAQLAIGVDHPAISRRPVNVVAREGADLAGIDDDQSAVPSYLIS
jgi:hypothetical protein